MFNKNNIKIKILPTVVLREICHYFKLCKNRKRNQKIEKKRNYSNI